MKLCIERAETDDFLNWCRGTIGKRSTWHSIRPYDSGRDAIVFSFDIDLNLFLGNSYGQNRREWKTYFSKTPAFMDKIRQLTLGLGRKRGGRVFIDNTRAYYVDRASQPRDLCTVNWPTGIDIVREVKDYWEKLPRRSHMTIRLGRQAQN